MRITICCFVDANFLLIDQVDKQLASGEYFLKPDEKKIKEQQKKTVAFDFISYLFIFSSAFYLYVNVHYLCEPLYGLFKLCFSA